MSKRIILFLLVLLVMNIEASGQDAPNRETVMIINQVAQENLVSNYSKSGMDGVYLNQVGQSNVVDLSAKSNSAKYLVNQVGNNNGIFQKKTAKVLDERMDQLGNNNRIFEIANQYVERSNSQVLQRGNNLRVEKYGNNSIGASMGITLTGEARTIIVRNYR